MNQQLISARAEGGRDRVALAAALGGLAASVLTGAACVGPLIAIVLGIGGFGWLTQYAYLRVPASIATFALLGVAFWWVYGRGCKRPPKSSVVVLWIATALALSVNVFEYLIFPNL